VEKIEAVEAEDVKRHACFTMQAPSIAALGPIGRLESHAKFSERFSGRFDPAHFQDKDKMHAAE
jgi:hypothetical protein